MGRKRVEQALRSWDDADEVMQEIGRIDRELGKLEAHQNKLIDKIKAETKFNSEHLTKEKQALELQLEQFCESRKDEFKTVRSKKLTFGTVSFRLTSKLVAKSWERVLGACKDLGWNHCVRIKEEPDKEALKALGPDKLALVHCKLKVDDVFGYEIDQAKIVAAEDAA